MSHIFKKYKQIFEAVCVNVPDDNDFKIKRVKIQRTVTTSELYKFVWTFYCYIKTKFPHSIEDVMSSSQLLLAVMDYCFGEVFLSNDSILSEDVKETFRYEPIKLCIFALGAINMKPILTLYTL